MIFSWMCAVFKKKNKLHTQYFSNTETLIKHQLAFVSLTRFIFHECKVQYKHTSSQQSATLLTDWSQKRVQIC